MLVLGAFRPSRAGKSLWWLMTVGQGPALGALVDCILVILTVAGSQDACEESGVVASELAISNLL